MQDAQSLQKSIHAQFPLLFGGTDLVSNESFFENYNSVADYSAKSAEPALKTETHKLQWTLTASSVGLIALILFKVGSIKIGDSSIKIDRSVLVWYGAFLVALTSIFILRASLDLTRAALARQKDTDKLGELSKLVTIAFARRNIQTYFWLEIYNQIGKRFDLYQEIIAKGGGSKPLGSIEFPKPELNLDELKSLDEFTVEIKSHEDFINTAAKQLDKDFERFEAKALQYDFLMNQPSNSFPNSYQIGRYMAIHGFFEKHLEGWLNVRNQLTDKGLKVVLDERVQRETKMLKAQRRLLRKADLIRRLYAFTEIALPVGLAIATLCYLAQTLSNH